MATYHWAPAGMADVFVLPAAVVDEALKLATAEQLQVLLWFSRHHQQWDSAACAAAIGVSSAECESHLQFWVQQGLLQPAEAAGAAATAPQRMARPAAVKPRLQEVLAYQQEHRDFSVFLEEISARLGKPLSHGDVATLLYLITTAGVPQATILLITGYMVSLGKTSMRYIEVTTLDWQDRDIVSPADVDAHIQKLQNDRKAADRVQGLLGIPQRFGDLNAEKVARWVLEWGFSDEMLRLAYQQTVEKCKKYTVSYMDKVLEGWHINGITTPEQLEKPRPAKKGAAVTNPEESSLDMEGFEEQLLQYRPKYKKK